ncbi:hypothetical protein B0T16DRAFT_390484 [Cercophora newfieldiana]|uniref:DUF7708 domain-containing protein n=1 Tax=Cercophora newfieldiana TaxID=92897 RepID=A0AA40CP89_9PEZI|nr:hypothetical protein B0T16DRAFT_390484 [Cercophora newfieldiana]
MEVSLQETTSVAFRIRTDPNALVSWTGESDNGDPSAIAVASDAFKAVKTHFERSTTLNEQEKKLVTGSSSIEDVQLVVTELVDKYDSKGDSSKTRKWLVRTSETICHYSAVLDVFVQHNPEYVALVWGTFKLLFSSVVNHAETLKLLAKSTSEIATRLPRIKILSQLYATQQMRLAVDNLYSCILEFLLSAHAWCNESKFRHFYHSFTRPHKLRYHELLDRITDCSNNVIELAALGSQAEIRVMHTSQARKLEEILNALEVADRQRQNQLNGLTQVVSRLEGSEERLERKLDLILSLLEASGQTVMDLLAKTETLHYLQTSSQLDTNQSITPPQLMDVTSSLTIAFEDPDKTYRHHLFLRNWRATKTGASASTNQFWLSQRLAQWSSRDNSSLIIVKGPFNSRQAILDFGTSVIQTLTTSAVPTIWALKGPGKSTPQGSRTLTPLDLMKYLTYQVLRLSSDQTEKQMALCHSQFRDAKTLKEGLLLLKHAAASLPGRQIYLVVDLAVTRPDSEPGANLIRELHQMLIDSNNSTRNETKIKVLLLLYEADWFRRLPKEVNDRVVLAKVMKSKNARQRKEMQQAVNTRVFSCYGGMRGRGRGRLGSDIR